MVKLSDATSAAAARLRVALNELRDASPAAAGDVLRRVAAAADDLAHAAALDVADARLAGDAAGRRTAGELLDRLASADRVARGSLIAALVSITPAAHAPPADAPPADAPPADSPQADARQQVARQQVARQQVARQQVARQGTPPPWFPRDVLGGVFEYRARPGEPAAPARRPSETGAPAAPDRRLSEPAAPARRPSEPPTYPPAEAPVRLPTWGGWKWSAVATPRAPETNPPAKRRWFDSLADPSAKRR